MTTLKNLIKDRYLVAMAIISLIGLLLATLPLATKMSALPSEVAFWYTQPTAQRLAEAQYLWLLPGIAAISLVINYIISFFLYRRYPTAVQLLFSLSAVCCLLAAAGIIQTILIYTTLL